LLLQIASALLHTPLLLLEGPEQHARPRSPHLAQVPLLRLVSADVHEPAFGSAPQQGRPGPPQVPQAPALQTPPPSPTQIPPWAMQIPDTHKPPPLQALPEQQAKPGSPQVAVVPPWATPPLPTIAPTTTLPPGGFHERSCKERPGEWILAAIRTGYVHHKIIQARQQLAGWSFVACGLMLGIVAPAARFFQIST
jgi:hypothetical protein